jgi:hypothetical protein
MLQLFVIWAIRRSTSERGRIDVDSKISISIRHRFYVDRGIISHWDSIMQFHFATFVFFDRSSPLIYFLVKHNRLQDTTIC